MSEDNECVSIKGCTLPGTINVTPQALDLAKRFQTAVPSGYIVTFSWYDGERVRASKTAPWVDNGPGIDLGAYSVEQIPEEAVYQAGSFRYAVLIRKDVVDRYPNKTIDLDASGNPILE
jgi:hypothetical protein